MKTEDENLLEDWFLKRNLSSGTRESYQIVIREYSELIGKTPTELLDEAETEEDAGIRPRKRQVTHYLLKFKKHLEDNNMSPGYLSLNISAIKSFYKAFDITLPEIKVNRGDIGLEKNMGKPLIRNDIVKLISSANHRERALIYLMALSGMGQQEARDLTIKKLIQAASSATEIQLETVYDLFKHEERVLDEVLTLEIIRKKVNYRHYTFIPPEASREIISYLKERCYGRNEKIRIADLNEPIFVNNNGRKLSRDSIVTNFRRIGQQAGFQKESGTYAFWRSHALRKYFISTIINKIGEKTIADYMAGHKISEQDRTYWKTDPDDLKRHYIKALPYLSIDEAQVKDFESPEYRELKSTMSEKEDRISNLEEEVQLLKEVMNDSEYWKNKSQS
ncbi:MAG TPA: tyrosine-type recombinase/integrase [Methanobacterium sp.]|jgi:integrase|nr:MAG: site-specific integrase [Methanobacterium sp.]HOI71409.1 tyrosine-type recombinase/integrase [Methanobacterium sp.]